MSQAQLAASGPSVSLIDNRPATTSLDIAKFFGKDHGKVIRDIRNLLESCPTDFTEANFGLSAFTDPTGRKLPMYTVFFDGFMLLVMGYTGKKALGMKLAYIGAFNTMREQLEGKKPSPRQRRPRKALPAPEQLSLEATQFVKASASGLLERKASLYTAGSEIKRRVWMPPPLCPEEGVRKLRIPFQPSGMAFKVFPRHEIPSDLQTSTAANHVSPFSVTVLI